MAYRYSDEALLELAAGLAVQAGQLILDYRARGISVTAKADRSLVTDADNAAEALILAGLRAADPGISIIAEEAMAAGMTPEETAEFWLVDPLDGTREFAAGLDDFAVNVGLVRHGRPVLGAVSVPARGAVFCGCLGEGAFRRDATGEQAITARPVPESGVVFLVSRFNGGEDAALPPALAGRAVAGHIRMGSAAKFCVLAEGGGDFYPRRGRTMEWDTAAPQAVVEAAGGAVLRMDDDSRLAYGKPGFENPSFYAIGRP